jgi:polyisoprenoid-binding protein YceI
MIYPKGGFFMFKHLALSLTLVTSVSAFAKAKPTTEKLTVDAATSKVVYTGKKAIVDSKHSGDVKIKDGYLSFDGDTLKGGEFTIDMGSITNTDIADAEYNKKFVGHIAGEDFFDVKKFPTSKLVIKSATKTEGDKYKIVADLTIKGKKAPVNFEATVTKGEATANIVVDRTAHDVKYGSGKFFQGLGDKAIADTMDFNVTLKTKK